MNYYQSRSNYYKKKTKEKDVAMKRKVSIITQFKMLTTWFFVSTFFPGVTLALYCSSGS